MGTTTNTVTGTVSKLWNYVCTIRPQDRTHLKQTTAVVGVIVKPKNDYYHSNEYYPKH